tara:strand:+ start:401 stop:577 length:177 start_codon:yes stop_codon:yes gene_type:complete
MSTVSLILLGLALTALCPGFLYLLWDYYKEREWKSNNEDEWIYQEAERRGMNKRKSKR